MKRQQAFEKSGNKMLKGCLHCHTSRSDGRLSPEDTMQKYYDNGYDFMAITDHGRYNFKDFVPELPLTIIPGVEVGWCFENYPGVDGPAASRRAYHTVAIGPAKEDGNGYEQDALVIQPKSVTREEKRRPMAEVEKTYQEFLDSVHENGNLTIYCHPEWSATPPRYFENQKGNFAVEIWNSISVINHDVDKDAYGWDELLGQGKMLYGVASDDTHRPDHACNGWVRVNAENNINSILDSLNKGAFYSSTGPEIYDFYINDEGKAVVECSPAARIRLNSDCHAPQVRNAGDEELTQAEFITEGYDYIRITVIDKNGKMAWTNPIFLDGRDKA